MPRHLAVLRVVAAAGGFALLVATLGFAGPATTRDVLIGWCVAVPYWHFLEDKLCRPHLAQRDAEAAFERMQAHSRWVWVGGAAAMAAKLAL